ncbi:MAG: aquaporin [Hyphomicrobiaceae bacterium]
MHGRALAAEFTGTFAILFVLFGAATISAGSADATTVVALAVGCAIIGVTYALGAVSGGHFNPAVTLGLVAGGRFDIAHAPGFIVAQTVGGMLAAGAIQFLLLGLPSQDASAGQAWTQVANVVGDQWPSIWSAALCEFLLAALFVIVFMGATSRSAAAALAPIAIGMSFAAFYVVAVPVTNGGLNPARSTGAAAFAGLPALAQLWFFWIVPIIGAVVGGIWARLILNEQKNN